MLACGRAGPTGSPSTLGTPHTSRCCSGTCAPAELRAGLRRGGHCDSRAGRRFVRAPRREDRAHGVGHPRRRVVRHGAGADPQVLVFQAKLIAAVAPFVESGGTAAAYVIDADERDINETTIDYVERFVPDHSGPNSLAHITVGYAKLDDLRAIEAEPFGTFAVHPIRIAVFHLGNNGTARTQLEAWTLAGSRESPPAPTDAEPFRRGLTRVDIRASHSPDCSIRPSRRRGSGTRRSPSRCRVHDDRCSRHVAGRVRGECRTRRQGRRQDLYRPMRELPRQQRRGRVGAEPRRNRAGLRDRRGAGSVREDGRRRDARVRPGPLRRRDPPTSSRTPGGRSASRQARLVV